MQRTRLLAMASLLTLIVGAGGLVAYLGGRSANLFSQGEAEELTLLPAGAALVAHADVHHVMTSELWPQLRSLLRGRSEAYARFQEHTGIDIENDIDRVFVAIVPRSVDSAQQSAALVLARGRFDRERIEAFMKERGAQVDDYKGVRVVVGAPDAVGTTMSLGFLAQDLIAVGGGPLVRTAVDLREGSGDSILANDRIARLLPELESSPVWAAGRFDALAEGASLPMSVDDRLPSIDVFTMSTRVDSGLQGLVRVETRDEQAAGKLRDVVRGFLALAQVQATVRPALRSVLDGLQLGGSGSTVTLAFDLPASAVAALDALAPPPSAVVPQK